ncbi:hypothetical protein STEG23_020900, partial [Scotinomys teguina]
AGISPLPHHSGPLPLHPIVPPSWPPTNHMNAVLSGPSGHKEKQRPNSAKT